jgi:8-oxo-dGTP pyrophosphatase MutT (NUDIX family)
MAHTHTEPGQHDQTASAFIIRTDFAEPKVVLHTHKLLKKYLQFGGHVELNENPWQAIAHELREESGYTLDDVQLLQPPHTIRVTKEATLHPQPLSHITHTFPGLDHYHTDSGYLFTTDHAPRHQPDPGETVGITLFTRQQLLDLPKDRIPENVRATYLFALETALKHWELVPTAHYTL